MLALSIDLKLRIPSLWKDGLTVKEICRLLSVKRSLVYLILNRWHTFGTVKAIPGDVQCGRPRKLSSEALTFIDQLLDGDGTMYIDEIQACVRSHLGILASRQCIKQALDSLHISHKRVSKIALERNELLRAAYMCHYADLVHTPDMLMCIDESSKDERTVARRWGYARLGKRCPSRQRFIRGTRYTILPVLGIDGY